MPDQEKGIMLALLTSQGPVLVGFSREGFATFVKVVNDIQDNIHKETPIPKVYEDAFKDKEE